MEIKDIIQKIKDYHYGYYDNVKIDETTTRDKVLFGDVNQKCTGIVTTCWASIEVIQKAIACGVNLIICHEALFWNHGDHTDWLEEEKNSTYLAKKRYLEAGNIVVWRNHDYVHSGIPREGGGYTDGIFLGLAHKLGWYPYIQDSSKNLDYLIPKTTVKQLSEFIVDRLNINGVKIIGNPDQEIERIRIPFHILGDARQYITEAEKEQIDCFLALEIVDFTLAEHVFDKSLLTKDCAIIGMGHFNLEEPGMEYMVNYIKELVDQNIPITYIQSGDLYHYHVK